MRLAHGYGSNYGLSAPRTQFSALSIKLNQGREKRKIFTYELITTRFPVASLGLCCP